MKEVKWVNIPQKGLKGLYEISNEGKVRSKDYQLFRDGELRQIKGSVLKEEENSVYLKSNNFYGWNNVGALYLETFGFKMANEREVRRQ